MDNVSFKPSEEFLELAEEIFQQEKLRILELIPSAVIEHIGSTAIPGSITKGDLDINVRVTKEIFDEAVEKLKTLYQINQPENWNDNFASFKDDNNFNLPIGVQLTIIDSEYDDFVSLRDLLISNQNLLEEYNQMKRKYEGRSMDDYRKEKSEFFEKLRSLRKHD